jgi:hypothetical protein
MAFDRLARPLDSTPAVMALASVVLASAQEELHAWLDRWAPAAEWGVAAGTLLLAVATFWLARRTREEAKAVATEARAVERQAELLSEQLTAAQRPFAYPIANQEWQGTPGRRIFLRNGGPGPALNVSGAVYWTGGAGGASSFVPTALAPA